MLYALTFMAGMAAGVGAVIAWVVYQTLGVLDRYGD